MGWNISNIGSKLNFDNGTSPAFLPTNLRIGTNFAFPLADYHTLSIGLDLNKLLVPTKPRRIDYADDEEARLNGNKPLSTGKTPHQYQAYSNRSAMPPEA